MGGETEPRGEEPDDDIEDGIAFAQDHDGEQRGADRADGGMDGIPGRIDPRKFVGQKFHGEEHARDGQDERIGQDFEALVGGREIDPVEPHREAGEKNGQVKVETGQRGQADGDTEELEDFHGTGGR